MADTYCVSGTAPGPGVGTEKLKASSLLPGDARHSGHTKVEDQPSGY